MIPEGRFDPQRLELARQWLRDEVLRALADRQDLEREWIEAYRRYYAQPASKNKSFPFEGASNLVIPLIATDVDTAKARYMSLLFAPDSLWTPEPYRPDFVDFARKYGEFLKWAQRRELRLEQEIDPWMFEICLLGTGVLKTRYRQEMRKVFEYREEQTMPGQPTGQPTTGQRVIPFIDRPEVNHLPLFDFVLPAIARDVPSATWAGERVLLTAAQLRSRVNSGLYRYTSRMPSYNTEYKGSQAEQELRALGGLKTSRGDKVELFELWFDWDIDGDGQLEALVATMHWDSGELVRYDFNPFFNQLKPYDAAHFIKVPTQFYGIGIDKMLWHFQEEVTTMHNQRIDNASVSNAQIIVAERTGTIREDEPIFPGRILLVDRIDEVKPMSLGSRMDSTIDNERISLEYAAKRVGHSDMNYGVANTTSAYGSLGAVNALQSEGMKRSDSALRSIRNALSEVGLKVAELYQQRNQHGKPFIVLGDEDGAAVQQVLMFPLELIRAGIGMEVTATSLSNSKEVKLRADAMVAQQLFQYYQQMQQYLLVALNPNVPPQLALVAGKAAEGMTLLMQRMLEAQGTQDASKMLPKPEEVRAYATAPAIGPAGGIPFAGTAGSVAGPAQAPGVPMALSGGY